VIQRNIDLTFSTSFWYDPVSKYARVSGEVASIEVTCQSTCLKSAFRCCEKSNRGDIKINMPANVFINPWSIEKRLSEIPAISEIFAYSGGGENKKNLPPLHFIACTESYCHSLPRKHAGEARG